MATENFEKFEDGKWKALLDENLYQTLQELADSINVDLTIICKHLTTVKAWKLDHMYRGQVSSKNVISPVNNCSKDTKKDISASYHEWR